MNGIIPDIFFMHYIIHLEVLLSYYFSYKFRFKKQLSNFSILLSHFQKISGGICMKGEIADSL